MLQITQPSQYRNLQTVQICSIFAPSCCMSKKSYPTVHSNVPNILGQDRQYLTIRCMPSPCQQFMKYLPYSNDISIYSIVEESNNQSGDVASGYRALEFTYTLPYPALYVSLSRHVCILLPFPVGLSLCLSLSLSVTLCLYTYIYIFVVVEVS